LIKKVGAMEVAMKMLKKYIGGLAFLSMMGMLFIAVDAKNPITKKSIRQIRQAQQLRRAYATSFPKPVQYRFKKVSKNNRVQARISNNSKNNATTTIQNQVIQSKVGQSSIPVKQETNEQHYEKKPVVQNVNEVKTVQQQKIPMQKNILPEQKNESETLVQDSVLPSLQNKNIVMDGQNKIVEGPQDKDVPVDEQDKINTDTEEHQKIKFLKQLSQLSSDKLEQIFQQMNLNEEQKEQIKKQLKDLPAILKELEDDLQNPNSPAGQVMQGKGWLEWFRTDLLNYPWAKTGVSLLSNVWNYTGGALLKHCGITFSEETKKDASKGTFLLIHTFLGAFGLDTPGGVLDSFFMATLYSYFPKENTWSGTFAKTAFAIGYFGALRGMTKQAMVWKGIEAFLCTSYCKYFAQDNADYLRVSYLQRPINFFYQFIPKVFRNGKIEYLISQNKLLGSYKYLTSLIGMGSALAHIAMSTASSQPKIAE
jgi:hypothetical protein